MEQKIFNVLIIDTSYRVSNTKFLQMMMFHNKINCLYNNGNLET